MAEFVHLHNHTHYSLQDAACTVESLLHAAEEDGMKALALTDHGVMFGAASFYNKAKKLGIKPIIGFEAYIVMDGSRFDKKEKYAGVKKRARPYNHLLLIAKGNEGYRNLSKLCSLGFTEGFYYRPRIDMELLQKYSSDVICSSACLAGPVSSALMNGDKEKAREYAVRLHQIFGDDFYLELQNHFQEEDKLILEGVPPIARELGIKLLATNDIHYIKQEDAYAHNILLHFADKSGEVDWKKLRYKTDQIYFKTQEEMTELFKDYPEAIESSLEIADKVRQDIEFGKMHYPRFPIPEQSHAKTLDEYLSMLARKGLHERFSDITKEIDERFTFELSVIERMGFAGYFLIVQDFINASKERGIPVGPGRGSAAGSLVAYALKITDVNPLEYDLLFERFLNPARASMPDIDVDFADDQRGEAIDYVKEKYGAECVCQIVSYNKLTSKAVLRDVARVLNIPIPTVNSITKFIPSKFGKVFTIEQAINEVPELKWVKETKDPDLLNLIKYAKVLEGMNRNLSKHAAGVVIAPSDVSDYVPVAVVGDGDLVTQFDKKELESSAGLLKMDFLGLRTLSIIRDTLKLIKNTRDVDLVMADVPLDDKETYEIFSEGKTTAVFQFESGPMREYLKRLQPQSIKDLSAMNALYRPGPMEFIDTFIDRKFGRIKTEYQHQLLEPILSETYGIIVYQEQVIQIANKIAGMSLAEADLLRRAMSKKDLKTMAQMKIKFIEGAAEANNIPEKISSAIYEAIDKFANYGFNKSHAVAYSIVAYHTAYLKTHYLPEFLAANLTNEFGNSDKVTSFLDDARKLKVEVLPPDVNVPSTYFNVIDGKIVFGMCAIKNVGVNAVAELERARHQLGRDFKTIYDLTSHCDTRILNKRALEGLVLAGAMDSLEGSRAQKFAAIEDAITFGGKVRNSILQETEGLFADVHDESLEIQEPDLPELEPWDAKESLTREREVLGFYLSDHPLRKFAVEYNSFATVHLGETETFMNKTEPVYAVGVVTGIRTKIDKSGGTMAFFEIDDFTGSCQCLMFSKIYKDVQDFLKEEECILVKGRPETNGDSLKLNIDELKPLKEIAGLMARSASISIDSKKNSVEDIEKLKGIISENQGTVQLYINLMEDGTERHFLVRESGILPGEEFSVPVMNLFGEESLKYYT